MVVDVEGVPGAAAVVGLGLEEDGAMGEGGELLVLVFEEVAGVESDLEPGRVDGLDDAFDAGCRAAEAPVVLKAESDAAFLGLGNELRDGVDDPLESLLFGVAGEGIFDAFVGHEVVEVFGGSPGAGVEAHGGDAEAVGLFDLGEGLGDVGFSFLGIRGEETLVGGEAHEVEAEGEGALLDALESGVALILHLDLEDLDAVEAEVGGVLEADLDGTQFLAAEAPRRNRWRRRWGCGASPPGGRRPHCGEGCGRGCREGAGQEAAS